MKKDDIQLYREIQKNAQMGRRAIETITPKVYDDSMALMLTRDLFRYGEIQNEARKALLAAREVPPAENKVSSAMLTASIHANTLLNTSTSHIAEMMIRGSNMGMTQLWKALNKNGQATDTAVELAKELVDFEENNIKELKKYL